jgi:hypothetical protein
VTSTVSNHYKNVQAEAQVVDFEFDELSDDGQVCGRNATNFIAMYLNFVSPRRASRHAGTDVTV